MKSKKIIILLIFLITFLTLNSKVFAITLPYLAINSKNYSAGDKVNYEKDATIETGNALQLYAVIQVSNEDCPNNTDECGIFVKKKNLSGVTWTSSNTAVATVDNTGKVTGVSKGKVTITAKCDDETITSEDKKSATYEINVQPKNNSTGPKIIFYYDEPGPAMILNSEEKYGVGLVEIPSTERENIKFKIENENIAKITKTEYDKNSVDAMATVKHLSVGKTKLIATLNYNGQTYTASYEINVKKNSSTQVDPNGNVTVNPETGTILIVFAWIIGLSSLGFTFWHFKKIK